MVGPEQIPARFQRLFMAAGLATGVLVALALGVGVGLYGGIPHAYDRFGVVGVPGRQVLTLPSGRVMIDRVDDVYLCWDNTNHTKNPGLNQAPDGMAIRVTSADANRAPIKLTPVSHSLYEGHTGCRGHHPYGRIDLPKAGRYLVQTGDKQSGGFAASAEIPAASTQSSTSGPGFAFGPAPFAPFGSPLLAAILATILVFGAETWLAAVGFLIWGDETIQSRLRQLRHPFQLLSNLWAGSA